MSQLLPSKSFYSNDGRRECLNLIHNFLRKEKYNYTEIDTKKIHLKNMWEGANNSTFLTLIEKSLTWTQY